jgi:DNA replication and repair protein RecF
MQLKEIWISNFRCISNLHLNLQTNEKIIFIGENSQGKTSILEAIYLLLNGSAFNSTEKTLLIKRNEARSEIRATVDIEGDISHLKVVIEPNTRLSRRLNDKAISKEASFKLAAVGFESRDLEIVKGGPQERRQFLDFHLKYVSPVVKDALIQYDKVLKHRGALLKNIAINIAKADELNLWDEKLIEYGEVIYYERERVLKKIGDITKRYWGYFDKNERDLIFNYKKSWIESMAKDLKKERVRDIQRVSTSVGPHRDDIEIIVGNLAAKTGVSQGDQRTVVLCLKLASIEFLAGILGYSPVILLDDIFSELDKNRVNKLLELLPDAQMFITTVWLEKRPENSTVFEIKNGAVIESR